MIMAENNPLEPGTTASPEPGSQEELDNAVREVGYDGSGDGRLPDLLREAGYDTSLWEPEPEYEANRYNDYIADQVIPDDTPRAPSAGWNEVLIRKLIQTANDTPAWAADEAELLKLRDIASLGLAELHDLEWHPGNRDYDEPGHREQAVLDLLNERITDGEFSVADAGEIVDYAHATNILRLIDEDRSTNYLDSVEAYQRVDFALNRTGKNPIPVPDGPDPGPVWSGQQIMRLVETANETPARLAGIVEAHNLRDGDWLELPGIEDEWWFAGSALPGEDSDYGQQEEAMLVVVNIIAAGSFDNVDAAHLVDYASATNILREIDEAQGTNYLHSVESYRQAAIDRNRSAEADRDVSAGTRVGPEPFADYPAGKVPQPVDLEMPNFYREVVGADIIAYGTVYDPLEWEDDPEEGARRRPAADVARLRQEISDRAQEWTKTHGPSLSSAQETGQPSGETTNDAAHSAEAGLPPADDPFVAREFRLDQFASILEPASSAEPGTATDSELSPEADGAEYATAADRAFAEGVVEFMATLPDEAVTLAEDLQLRHVRWLDHGADPQEMDWVMEGANPPHYEGPSGWISTIRDRATLDLGIDISVEQATQALVYTRALDYVSNEWSVDAPSRTLGPAQAKAKKFLSMDEFDFRDNYELEMEFSAGKLDGIGKQAIHELLANTPERVAAVVDQLDLEHAAWVPQPMDDTFARGMQIASSSDPLPGSAGEGIYGRITDEASKKLGIDLSDREVRDVVSYTHAARYFESEIQGEERPAPAPDVVIESIADQMHADRLRGIRPELSAPNDPDSTRASEVPVDDGVRVDPIAADTNTPGAQAAPRPDQRVHDIASWLRTANERALAGETVKPPRPIKEVLGHFKSAPIDQTRIQILAAAAAARTLEGEQSVNAQRLNKLVVETQTRLNAIRDHERRTAALEHREKETPREKIAEWDQNRIDREAANDRNVFNAAAAVAAGYVAARGLPARDQLAQLADEQLGPVPQAQAPDKAPRPDGPSKAGQIKNVLDSAGRGLAQAVGPVAGDDEVAPNLSPVNITQVTEEFAQLAAAIAPAMKAAMNSHPRPVKDLLNIEQTPDEESDLAFEQNTGLGVERERETEHSV